MNYQLPLSTALCLGIVCVFSALCAGGQNGKQFPRVSEFLYLVAGTAFLSLAPALCWLAVAVVYAR